MKTNLQRKRQNKNEKQARINVEEIVAYVNAQVDLMHPEIVTDDEENSKLFPNGRKGIMKC